MDDPRVINLVRELLRGGYFDNEFAASRAAMVASSGVEGATGEGALAARSARAVAAIGARAGKTASAVANRSTGFSSTSASAPASI